MASSRHSWLGLTGSPRRRPAQPPTRRPQTYSSAAGAESNTSADCRFRGAEPDRRPDPSRTKGYALFYLGLSHRRAAAIGEPALFGRERHVLIRPGRHGLVLHTLFYANEVNIEDEYQRRFDLVSHTNAVVKPPSFRALTAALVRIPAVRY